MKYKGSGKKPVDLVTRGRPRQVCNCPTAHRGQNISFLGFSGRKRNEDLGRGTENTWQSQREGWSGSSLSCFHFSVFCTVDNKPQGGVEAAEVVDKCLQLGPLAEFLPAELYRLLDIPSQGHKASEGG